MSPTFTAKEQSLTKAFSDDHVFTMPGDQRHCAWGEEQAEELLGDLVAALGDTPAPLSNAAPSSSAALF